MTSPDATGEPQGWRVLGCGRDPEVSAAIQEGLRAQGIRARAFALTDDPDGDARLERELREASYDGVAIGGFINGQNPDVRPAFGTTLWFNRVLNIIHSHAPQSKIILVREPADALPAIQRILGPSRTSSHLAPSHRRRRRPIRSCGVVQIASACGQLTGQADAAAPPQRATGSGPSGDERWTAAAMRGGWRTREEKESGHASPERPS